MKEKTQTIAIVILLVLFVSTFVIADHPSFNSEGKITISFVLPKEGEKKTSLTYSDVSKILVEKPLPKDLHIDTYKIDWWIFGALQKLDLKFKVKTVGKTGHWKSAITEIGGYKNDSKAGWIYFVNGIKSNYHISTQLDEDVKTIRFIYKLK